MSSSPPASSTANQQIARAAGIVMLATVLSNVVGLVRQILVNNAFGTRAAADAFNAAVQIPDVLFSLLAGGALASAFIPMFSGLITQEDREGAWKLASAVMNLVALSLAVVAGISALFAPQIVRYVLFSLISNPDPANLNLTVNILRIILIAPAIFGVSGLIMGILNTHQNFLLPAMAPVFNWVGWVLGILFLVPSMGIYGLAWGYVLGATLHLLVQLPGLLRLKGRRYIPTLGLRDRTVREVFRLMAPRLFGVAVVQLNFVVITIIAYSLPEGSLTAVNQARIIMTMPLFVIAASIATAALPTFSAQVARGEMREMQQSLAVTLRGVLLLSLPAALGLILLRVPIITLFLQRGAFDAHSTQLVAWALLWFAAGLVGFSLVEVLSRAFYALHDTRTPVTVGVIAMSLNVAFSFLFAKLFSAFGWMPHGGLALANSLATAIEAAALLILMRRRLGGLHGQDLLTASTQSGLGTLGMCLAIWGWLSIAAIYALPAWLLVIVGVSLGGLVYIGILALLGVRELNQVLGFMKKRLARG
jgi:putative peptidoglycan lipid II flippase